MATKVDRFVEESEGELQGIKGLLEQVALRAQVLVNRWAALGKQNMAGWAEYTWASKPYTAAELQAALNGLNVAFTDADATNLTNIHTSRPIDKIVKAGL